MSLVNIIICINLCVHSHCLSHLASPFPSALELLKTAIEKAGFTDKVVVGMDVAASEFYRDGKYDLDFKSPPNPDRHISAEELSEIYQSFVNNYPGEAGYTSVYMCTCLCCVPCFHSGVLIKGDTLGCFTLA